MERRRAATIGGLAAAVGAGAWLAQRRVDERRVRADPDHAILSTPPQGEVIPVTSADGTTLHAEAFGPEDAPVVVFAHGWTCALRFWTYQIRELARDHRVIAYDQRGHGRSGIAHAGDWSADRLGDDLQAVLETCVPDGRRATLVGHSMGGITIVAWAGGHPEEVERRAAAALLCNTGMGDLVMESLVVRTPAALGSLKKLLGQAMLSVDGPLPSSPTPLVYRAIRYVAHGPIATPAQVALSEELVINTRREARVGCGASLSRLEIHRSLERLTVPTGIVAAECDRLTPPVLSERMAEQLPDLAGMVVVPRSGHMTPLEAPGEITSRVRELEARAGVAESAPA